MDEEILNKYATKNSINNIPYSNFFVAQKRKMLEEEYANRDNFGHVNKRAKISLYDNFESLKKLRLSENDVCIDHFKDMDKYINQVKELRSIYNFLFSDHLTNEHDILHVNRKFCSIQCNEIIDRNIFFESSAERSSNGLYSFAKGGLNVCSDALIRKKGMPEMEAHGVTVGEKSADWGSSRKNIHTLNGDSTIDNYPIQSEENLEGLPGGSGRIPPFGRRILNSVSNQVLYIDDLSPYDILLLVSLVTQLQNEQKENEKEEKNLEVLANIDEFQVNAHSLKEIFRNYFKEKSFQCFTCGLRFSSSLEKLNHLENHYEKNKYYTSGGVEKPGANRNRKKIVYLDHMSISIEFFICKEYSIFEDVYENIVTKNYSSFNYNAKWEADRKTIHVERNYGSVNDSALLKTAKGESDGTNFASRVIGLADNEEPGDVENAFDGNPNMVVHARKENNLAQCKREPPPETLDFYISPEGNKLNEAEDAPLGKNVEEVFHFGKKSNEMDNFFWARQNEPQNKKNEKKKKNLHNVENDDNDSSSDNENDNKNNSRDRNDTNNDNGEVDFFDFIYGNQNTYEVNLSNYYTVTDDNNVHINYIDGEVMFKNILKCLEIKDIKSYVFPSWIPRRSIKNFLVRPVTEMYGQQVTSSNSFANLTVAKGMGNLFMNKYAPEDSPFGNKLAVQSNVWNLCTSGEFYLSKQLVPMNVFFSLPKMGRLEGKREEYHEGGYLSRGGDGKVDPTRGEFQMEVSNRGAPLQDVNIKVSDELGKEPVEGGNRRELKSTDYPTDEFAVSPYHAHSEACEHQNDEEQMIAQSFLHIFGEKYFSQTSAFKETFLFYLRSNYFEMSHHFSNHVNFNDIEERLYSYIQNNFTQKMPLFDTNNYHPNECFLCKEKLQFDYSYEYNDFYYTDAVAVDLNNLLEEEEDKEQTNTYSFSFSANRIDELSDRCIYNDPSYDILDNGIREAEIIFQKVQNGDACSGNGVSQLEEEKNNTTIATDDSHLGEKYKTVHNSVHMNELLENVKKIIGENCVLKKTVIESALKYNCQIKNMNRKKKKKKDDHIQHYNNLFKSFCIPYETVSILHDIQKENQNRSSVNVNNVSQFDINHEYANDEIDDFVNYFENATQQVTNSLFENIYKGKKMDKHIFTHMTNCYINDDNEKKDSFTHIYFPSKNYLHTNFTYFHHQCFKNYVQYFIFPYYFLTKLDDHLFKKIVISAVRQFFKAYHRICKFGTSGVKHAGGSRPCEKKRPTPKAGQLQRRRHF
ncbi:Uncharacterized protein PCOAH_00045290 [Plasmodium coatneyi]|uniref:C2H2-type domain-containing protein n=1 Tax=Plasmodium coatneyi TaxID=208452 RepID=A0A1B1E3Z2_9APIC|nr:Uncharacterized protein PCOAH_00045290 [Plasmodium coatneyi]ANQ09744.1 Uncharacterized protein PCOAH_00045290 [Plasmodium coatneyi]